MRLALRLNLFFTTLLLLMLVVSCGKEPDVDLESKQSSSIGLNIALSEDIVVRSVPTSDELTIYDGYFFIFDSDGTYVAHQSFDEEDIWNNGLARPIITLNVAKQIVAGSKVVIIINHAPANSTIGTPTFAQVNDLFPLTATPLIDGAATAFRMPMYGVIDNWTPANEIPITRAMAKVQLRLGDALTTSSGGDHGDENFEDLTKVKYKIYQYASRGRVAPATTGLINAFADGFAAPIDLISDGDITNVVMAQNDVSATTGASYIYEFNYATKRIDGDGMTATAVDIANKTADKRRLAIIVKANDRYYRLDMCRKDPTTGDDTYIDIKRNTHYTITIIKVDGDGYPSATEALRFPPSNVEYDIESDGSDDTQSNGQYSLSMESRYDNYVSTTTASVIMDMRHISGVNGDATTAIIPGAGYSQYITVTQTNVDGTPLVDSEKLMVENPTLKVTATEQGLVWRVTSSISTPRKSKITIKYELGSLAIERSVVVEILGVTGSYGLFNRVIDVGVDETIEGGTWVPEDHNHAEEVRFSADFTKMNILENATPTGWIEAGSTSSSSPSIYDSRPTFSPRVILGDVVTYTDKGDVRTRLDVSQEKSYYFGRSGSEITSNNVDHTMGDIISSPSSRRYKRLITGSRNEVNLDGTSTIAWGEAPNSIFLKIFDGDSDENGFANTEYIRRDNVGSARIAADGLLYCYRRNGSAVGEYVKVTTWYMPAIDQLLKMYDNKVGVDNIPTEIGYWSSSESESGTSCQVISFSSSSSTHSDLPKNNAVNIRCVRDL